MTAPALPRALQRWGPELAIFPPDVAALLGGYLTRLSNAVGPFAEEKLGAHGEPDGYDGLTRKGPPERLLLSEWAMALEHPDEFLRRAIQHEQGYLKRAHRHRASSRCCWALFDAGPEVLGAPRLAQLAALVLLARRAHAAGATFMFLVAQEEPERWEHEVTPQSVRRLLAQRSARAISDDFVLRWREHLDPRPGEDELWLISSARHAKAGGLQLAVEEREPAPAVVEAGRATGEVEQEDRDTVRAVRSRAPELEVAVLRPGRAPRAVTLALPEEQLAVRVLRDPFEVRVSEPRKLSPGALLGFHFIGGRGLVCATAEPEGTLVRALPIGDGTDGARVRSLRVGHDPLAAIGFRTRGGVVAATVKGQQLTLHGNLPSVGLSTLQLELPDSIDPPASPVALHSLRSGSSHELLAFRSDRCTVRIDLERGKHRVKLMPARAALFEVDGMLLAARPGPRLQFESWRVDEEAASLALDRARAWSRVVFGCSPRLNGPLRQALVGVESEEGRWLLLAPSGDEELHTEPDARVFGAATRDGSAQYRPLLLALDDAGRELHLVGHQERDRLWTFPEEVTEAIASTLQPWIAYRTRSGSLGVYSLKQQKILLQWGAQ